MVPGPSGLGGASHGWCLARVGLEARPTGLTLVGKTMRKEGPVGQREKVTVFAFVPWDLHPSAPHLPAPSPMGRCPVGSGGASRGARPMGRSPVAVGVAFHGWCLARGVLEARPAGLTLVGKTMREEGPVGRREKVTVFAFVPWDFQSCRSRVRVSPMGRSPVGFTGASRVALPGAPRLHAVDGRLAVGVLADALRQVQALERQLDGGGPVCLTRAAHALGDVVVQVRAGRAVRARLPGKP